MTFATHDARKAELAGIFGRALRAALRRRRIGKLSLARQVGISRNALTYYERGLVLPRFASACRIADALSDDELARVVAELRTLPCAVCGRPFANEGQFSTRYCGPSCQGVAAKMRAGRATRISIARAERQLSVHRAAVEQMCRECEPAGACRTADCPLRLVSPYPLVERGPSATPPPGRWGNGSRPNGAPLARAVRA